MAFYLILDVDYAPNAANMAIVASSPKMSDLQALQDYDPADKSNISTQGLRFKYMGRHDLVNRLSGAVDPAAIYKA
jgi:hypothetical protein